MELYRQTSLGIALKKTLDQKDNLDKEVKNKIWQIFDEKLEEKLASHNITGNLSGKLEAYQHIECDKGVVHKEEAYSTKNEKLMRLSVIIKDPKIILQPSSQSEIHLDKTYIKVYAIGENKKKKQDKKKADGKNNGKKKKDKE